MATVTIAPDHVPMRDLLTDLRNTSSAAAGAQTGPFLSFAIATSSPRRSESVDIGRSRPPWSGRPTRSAGTSSMPVSAVWPTTVRRRRSKLSTALPNGASTDSSTPIATNPMCAASLFLRSRGSGSHSSKSPRKRPLNERCLLMRATAIGCPVGLGRLARSWSVLVGTVVGNAIRTLPLTTLQQRWRGCQRIDTDASSRPR